MMGIYSYLGDMTQSRNDHQALRKESKRDHSQVTQEMLISKVELAHSPHFPVQEEGDLQEMQNA